MTDPKTRQAIKKMREDGASFAEIANFFSLSPNTVKSICYRSNTQTLSAPMQKSGLCRNCGRLLSPSANAGKRFSAVTNAAMTGGTASAADSHTV